MKERKNRNHLVGILFPELAVFILFWHCYV